MRSEYPVADCLTDIVENADSIAAYIAGLDERAFDANQLVRDAVERCLSRICEAAYRLGARGPQIMPDQPWADIRGMGNWLRHDYERVDRATVWETASLRVPELAEAARRTLATLE